MMLRSYKFRIYPNKEVERKLEENLEISRWLYNRLLEEINNARKEGRNITQRDTQALIVKLKEEYPELKKVYSKVLQMVNYQLWGNMRALSGLKKNGKKIGKLRYKKKDRFKTLNFNQSGFSIDENYNRISLSKIGSLKAKIHRKIDGKVKGVFVKKYPSGKWYAIVQVETESEELPRTGREVGIDVGIKYLLTDSDGNQIENPKFYEKTLRRIKGLHKNLSRKQKGSNNWKKAKIKLAKAYEKLNNQRRDFLHKLSRYYVNNYDFIAVEDLNIMNMVRNHRLAQRILDASWGEFIKMLSYKVEGTGKTVIKVNPRGTSKGLSFDDPCRDYISANRILMRGRNYPDTPVERRPLFLVTAKSVIEGQVFSMNQEVPCVSEGWFTLSDISYAWAFAKRYGFHQICWMPNNYCNTNGGMSFSEGVRKLIFRGLNK